MVGSLVDLRASFEVDSAEKELPFKGAKRTLSLSGPVISLTLAVRDTRLLVAYAQGPVAVYDMRALLNPGVEPLSPLHVFHSPINQPIGEIAANPGEFPQLIAILWGPSFRQKDRVVQLVDLSKMQVAGGWSSGDDAATIPSCSE